MKFNAVRLMLIVSLIIILLYIFGLFLPIIKNTKESKINNQSKTEFILCLFEASCEVLNLNPAERKK